MSLRSERCVADESWLRAVNARCEWPRYDDLPILNWSQRERLTHRGRRSADRRPQARRLDERSTRHGHEGRCDGERQEEGHAPDRQYVRRLCAVLSFGLRSRRRVGRRYGADEARITRVELAATRSDDPHSQRQKRLFDDDMRTSALASSPPPPTRATAGRPSRRGSAGRSSRGRGRR